MQMGNERPGAGNGSGGRNALEEAWRSARILRMRIAVALFRKEFPFFLTFALFVCGLLILGGRFLLPRWPMHFSLLLLLLSILCAGMLTLLSVRKILPDHEKLLVYLDRSGGLLSASLEVDPGLWRARIAVPDVPRVSVKPSRFCIPALLGGCFLLGTLSCPISHGMESPDMPRRLDVTEESAILEEKLRVLEEEKLLSAPEASEMKKILKEVSEKNDAGDAGATYSLLEELNRRADGVGEEAAQQAKRTRELADMLSHALEALSQLPGERITQGVSSELAEAIRQIAADNPALLKALREAGIEPGKLTPETMRKLAETLENCSREQMELLAKLMLAKLTGSKCRNPGRCSGENGACSGACMSEEDMDLAQWLNENLPQSEELLLLLAGAGQGAEAGTGGVSRGPGSAPLNLTGNTPAFTGKHRDFTLESNMPDPERTNLIVSGTGALENPEKEARAAQAGALRGGEAVVEQRKILIHPEHRAAVEQYFRKAKQ